MIKIEQLQTKKDFQKLMLDILNPLKPYYSPGRARLELGVTATNYDRNAIAMEAFSRPLWGLVPFLPAAGRMNGLSNATATGWPTEHVRGTPNTGALPENMTSVL